MFNIQEDLSQGDRSPGVVASAAEIHFPDYAAGEDTIYVDASFSTFNDEACTFFDFSYAVMPRSEESMRTFSEDFIVTHSSLTRIIQHAERLREELTKYAARIQNESDEFRKSCGLPEADKSEALS